MVAKNILKFCIRGLLKERQRKTLFLFLDALKKVLVEYVNDDFLEELQKELNVAMALLERDFPITIQV